MKEIESTLTRLTSNKGFEEWGEVFGDDVMAAADVYVPLDDERAMLARAGFTVDVLWRRGRPAREDRDRCGRAP